LRQIAFEQTDRLAILADFHRHSLVTQIVNSPNALAKLFQETLALITFIEIH
jgi:hypothetical protein